MARLRLVVVSVHLTKVLSLRRYYTVACVETGVILSRRIVSIAKPSDT